MRLVGRVLTEQHDERQGGRRYLSADSLATLTTTARRGIDSSERLGRSR